MDLPLVNCRPMDHPWITNRSLTGRLRTTPAGTHGSPLWASHGFVVVLWCCGGPWVLHWRAADACGPGRPWVLTVTAHVWVRGGGASKISILRPHRGLAPWAPMVRRLLHSSAGLAHRALQGSVTLGSYGSPMVT